MILAAGRVLFSTGPMVRKVEDASVGTRVNRGFRRVGTAHQKNFRPRSNAARRMIKAPLAIAALIDDDSQDFVLPFEHRVGLFEVGRTLELHHRLHGYGFTIPNGVFTDSVSHDEIPDPFG